MADREYKAMEDKLRIGYHCLTWGREGLPQAVEDIASLRYSGIEIFDVIVEDYEKRRIAFKQLLTENCLELAGIYVGGKLSTKEDFKNDLERFLHFTEFLIEFGGDILILGGGVRNGDKSVDDSIKQMAENCNRICERVNKMGKRAAYHPHLGTLIENRVEIERLMELTEPGLVWLAPDTGHITASGADAVEVFRTYIDRIAYVHLKDVNPKWLELKACKNKPSVRIFSELGTGQIDFPEIIKVLAETDYLGWLIVELDETETSPINSAEISKSYIEEKLGISFE